MRFLTLQIDDDYQEAKAVLQDITHPHPHPHPPSRRAPPEPYQIQASALTAALGVARSIVYSNREDWEGAVLRCRSFLEHCSLFGDPLHPPITELLASHAVRASKHFGSLQGAQAGRSAVDHLPFSTQLGIFGDGVDGSDVVPALLPTSLEEKIDRLRRVYSTARPGTERQRKCLKDLVRVYHTKLSLTDDTAFIEEAIKCNRRLVETTHPTDQSKFLHLSTFGGFLYAAFDRTKKVEYLDESIILHREVLGLESAQVTHFSIIQRLIWSLSLRWQLFGRRHDLDELMHLFASGVRDTIATVPSRFELACHWAHAARTFSHQSLQIAYQNAMSLMQSSLVFGPTLPIQHDRLVEKSDLYRTPLNFASYQIQEGQLEQSIETLEGRALLWSEMRGLRTSTDKVRVANPLLAERFTATSQELETLTTSAFSKGSVGMGDRVSEGDEWMGQLSGLMERQHELLKERDGLILQIRNLPDLKNFLVPLPFDSLRSAASHGPVIVINHCKWRSDIIIVLHDSPPSLIPTPYDFFDRANCLKDKLLTARENHGLDSEHYENALSSVLMGLYELVGRPVVERLKKLGIAEQSRVWWCPTSVFGYLPLHAMGPIFSDGEDPRYFSDVYISSYTPTLSALIASRERDTQASVLPTLLLAQRSPSLPGAWPDPEAIFDLITVRYFLDAYFFSYIPILSVSQERDTQVSALSPLLVAQPSPSLPGAWPDAEVIYDFESRATSVSPGSSSSTTVRYFPDEYDSYAPTLSVFIPSQERDAQASALRTLLVAQPSPSSPGTWTDGIIHDLDLQATILSQENTSSTTVLDAFQRHQSVYVAHRGELKTGNPFEAAMRFPNGECLTLLDIVRSRHPAGESALLPGPHTAQLTCGSLPDEALHLTAAVQFSGFRSVIGTMWGMVDEDGQSLAEAIYQSMFSGKDGREAYYERSAGALQQAVQQMRRRCLPLARWVNYVHHGA